LRSRLQWAPLLRVPTVQGRVPGRREPAKPGVRVPEWREESEQALLEFRWPELQVPALEQVGSGLPGAEPGPVQWMQAQWVQAQWVQAQWVQAQWVLAQWVQAQWVLAQWVQAQWVLAQWVLARGPASDSAARAPLLELKTAWGKRAGWFEEAVSEPVRVR
jgi:hypothetical protein